MIIFSFYFSFLKVFHVKKLGFYGDSSLQLFGLLGRHATVYTTERSFPSLGINTYLYIALTNLTIQPDTNHYRAHLSPNN